MSTGIALLEGSFSGSGESAICTPEGHFNLALDFGTLSGIGTIYVKRSLGGGAFLTVQTYTGDASEVGFEAEYGARYKITSTITSGTIGYRISK